MHSNDLKCVAFIGSLKLSEDKLSNEELKSIVWTISAKIYNYFKTPYIFGFSVLEKEQDKIHALFYKPAVAPKISAYFIAELHAVLQEICDYELSIKLGYGEVKEYGSNAAFLGKGPAYDLINYKQIEDENNKLLMILTGDDALDRKIEDKLQEYDDVYYCQRIDFLQSLTFSVRKEMEWIEEIVKGRKYYGGYIGPKLHSKLLNYLADLGEIGKLIENPDEEVQIMPRTSVIIENIRDVPKIESQLREIYSKKQSLQKKINIFICYSHKDKKYLNELENFLKSFANHSRVKTFSDKNIETGEEGELKIFQKIEISDIFIIFISQNFYASDFIQKKELSPILEKAENAEATIWVLNISPSVINRDPRINKFQALMDLNTFLAAKSPLDRQRLYKEIVDKICEKAGINYLYN